jgi:hypothetical protein
MAVKSTEISFKDLIVGADTVLYIEHCNDVEARLYLICLQPAVEDLHSAGTLYNYFKGTMSQICTHIFHELFFPEPLITSFV